MHVRTAEEQRSLAVVPRDRVLVRPLRVRANVEDARLPERHVRIPSVHNVSAEPPCPYNDYNAA